MTERKRGIAKTVEEILDSEKFWLDVQAYQNGDQSYMKAFLIDLCFYVQEQTRSRLIKAYRMTFDLPMRDQTLHLKGITDFDNYNLLLHLTPAERNMRLADLEGNKEKRKQYVDALYKKLMGGD